MTDGNSNGHGETGVQAGPCAMVLFGAGGDSDQAAS